MKVGARSRSIGNIFQFVMNSQQVPASIRYGKLVHLEYKLQVKLHIKNIFVWNPYVWLPITIVSDT
jgi:hypothetical protein